MRGAGADLPGAAEVLAAHWVETRPVRDRRLAEALAVDVDLGEAEAIALALEAGADLLLMDDRRGRAVATRLGQPVVGVLGILVEAKRRGRLSSVKPVVDALVSGSGFRVSARLYARVLEEAGE